MATAKKVIASFAVQGDLRADAVEAVKQYAEVEEDRDRVAEFARAVARELEQLARTLEWEPSQGAMNGTEEAGYACPVGDGTIRGDSHQADPCVYCHKVYHDRCFYTTQHPCVRAGNIEERKGYALKGGR